MSRPLLVLSLVLVLASEGRAQPLFRTAETLDWMAADSQVVVRAVVSDFAQETDGSKQKWNTVVLKVRETLKGQHRPFHTYVVPDQSPNYQPDRDRDDLLRRKKTGQELLVFLDDSKRPDLGVWWRDQARFYDLAPRSASYFLIELAAPAEPAAGPLPKVYTLDMQDPTEPKAILDYARGAVAAAAKVKQARPHKFRWPRGSAENIDRVVPVDERLERQARRWVESDDPKWRWEGARALACFKSDENVAALKKLLKDPAVVTHVRQEGERIIETSREYEVRQAAFAALKALGVEVPEPVLREPVPPKK
jgi:hypothetical protein